MVGRGRHCQEIARHPLLIVLPHRLIQPPERYVQVRGRLLQVRVAEDRLHKVERHAALREARSRFVTEVVEPKARDACPLTGRTPCRLYGPDLLADGVAKHEVVRKRLGACRSDFRVLQNCSQPGGDRNHAFFSVFCPARQQPQSTAFEINFPPLQRQQLSPASACFERSDDQRPQITLCGLQETLFFSGCQPAIARDFAVLPQLTVRPKYRALTITPSPLRLSRGTAHSRSWM